MRPRVEQAQRRGFTFIDEVGERTITTIGPKLGPRGHDDSLPWHELSRCDAVYFCAGDVDALRAARRARVLVATARRARDVAAGRGRARRAGRKRQGRGRALPARAISTLRRDSSSPQSGALGGWAQPGGPFTAAPVPAPRADSYGAGDCFVAGLAFALAAGLETPGRARLRRALRSRSSRRPGRPRGARLALTAALRMNWRLNRRTYRARHC